jgi:hypothetical protein
MHKKSVAEQHDNRIRAAFVAKNRRPSQEAFSCRQTGSVAEDDEWHFKVKGLAINTESNNIKNCMYIKKVKVTICLID